MRPISFLLLFITFQLQAQQRGMLSAKSTPRQIQFPIEALGAGHWLAGMNAGLISFSGRNYDHGGNTSCLGNAFGAWIGYLWQQPTKHAIRLQVGVRGEFVKPYQLENGSPGGQLQVAIDREQAWYANAQVVREFQVGKNAYLPLGIGINALLTAEHSGYIHNRISGRPEEWVYFRNTRDTSRRDVYGYVFGGIGFPLSPSLSGEFAIQVGNSGSTSFNLNTGFTIAVRWCFGTITAQ